MKTDIRFQNQSAEFWALVRYISEQLGYSDRSKKAGKAKLLRRYALDTVTEFAKKLGIRKKVILATSDYLNYRAEILETQAKAYLMNRDQAKELFYKIKKQYKFSCHLPYNKQKEKKKHLAYFTCIVNILTENFLAGKNFADNPRNLIIIKDPNGKLVKTLSRQIDGAYPSLVDPKAIWEIKEYYGTTTFGSRVADGVYETQLDGYEIREAEKLSSKKIKHYLLIDDYFTWWECGRSYLCRLVDIAHMGLVDEVIFGREIMDRWPKIVKSWI